MILSIHVDHPEPRKLQRAVDALEAGEIIAYPTDTVYGLGCDILNKKAVDRLYQIKGMDKSQPLSFVCPDLGDIAKYAIVENHAYRILRRYLPGPYCFILTATREVPRMLMAKRKTVGIRVPDLVVTRELAKRLGRPIISTTAARDGSLPMVDPHEIAAEFHGVDIVLDGGGGGTVASSVIDLTGPAPVVLREGAGPVDDFE
jgi:tRNA threonylcarbamoyl adenosine modification protein (Sua5/YciO/YrdC/YwlC family)